MVKINPKEKPIVSIIKCGSYERAEIERSLESLLSNLGGIASFIKPKEKVLVKPNLLRAAYPDDAVTTHPEVLRALIKTLKTLGADVVVGESPAGANRIQNVRDILRKTGIGSVCDEMSAPFVLLDRELIEIDVPGARMFKKLVVGKAITDADKVIGLAKLKTHDLTGFTGAVKLMFGVIPGLEKPRYHLRVPDLEEFANFLVDTYIAVLPELSIIDGVVAMDGPGPSTGDPFKLGCMIASANGASADIVAADLIGCDSEVSSTCRVTIERGLTPDLSGIEVIGDSLDDLKEKAFRLPSGAKKSKVPDFLREFFKNSLVNYPRVNIHLCKNCGACTEGCAAKAISVGSEGFPQIDKQRCITCYCCNELCPESAIVIEVSRLSRLFDFMTM